MFRLSKWMKRAIFVNVLMLMFFVAMDYVVWTRIPVDFDMLPYYSGTIENVRVDASYGLFMRSLSISGIHRTETLFESFHEQSSMPNFLLMVFSVSILVNVFMLWMAEKEKPSSSQGRDKLK